MFCLSWKLGLYSESFQEIGVESVSSESMKTDGVVQYFHGKTEI
jgi:hypothetical protein